MSHIHYILNQQPPANHLALLRRSFEAAESCFIALAYLKNEGLDLIRDVLTDALARKPVEIIIGLPYFNTHPEAIEDVHHLVCGSQSGILRIVDYGPWVFHCKLLCFDYEAYTEALVGSMNITLGGLVHNFEISSLARHAKESQCYEELEMIKRSIREVSLPASTSALADYRKRFEARKQDA